MFYLSIKEFRGLSVSVLFFASRFHLTAEFPFSISLSYVLFLCAAGFHSHAASVFRCDARVS
jgi:hypothetical protein